MQICAPGFETEDESSCCFGASDSLSRAAAAAAFGSELPLAISSKKSRCNIATARAFASAAAWSDLAVPVGGTLSDRHVADWTVLLDVEAEVQL